MPCPHCTVLVFPDGEVFHQVTCSNYNKPYKKEVYGMPRFTGLSLSGCVWDIARGVVAEIDVEFLLIGTHNNSAEQFARKIKANQEGYWDKAPREAGAIASRLYEAGKIRCPEPDELSCHNVAAGIWLTEKGTQCYGASLYDKQREEEEAAMAAAVGAAEEPRMRYYLQVDGIDSTREEVTKLEFIVAEQRAGFHPKVRGDCATAGFTGGGVHGETEFK